MTYEEVNALLKNIRHYKTIIANIKAEVAEIRSNLAWLAPLPGRTYTVSALKVVEQFEGTQEVLAEQMLALKDKEELLSEAINALPAEQKKVITEFYFRLKTVDKIAMQTPCGRRTVLRHKSKAIHSIARYMQTREGAD